MPRVIAMLILAVLALLALGLASQQKNRHRETFRPKRRFWPDRNSEANSSTVTLHAVDARELVGVRDAFSSAPVSVHDSLFRCGGCLAFYAQASIDALSSSNQGRCVACGGRDLAPVTVSNTATA
jgi:hypothetical protein